MLSIEPIRGELVGSRFQRPSWAPPVHWHPVWDLPRVPRKLPQEPDNELPLSLRRPEMGEASSSPRGDYPQPRGYGPSSSMPGGPPPFHSMQQQQQQQQQQQPGYGPPHGMHMGGAQGMPPDGYGMGMQPQGVPSDMWHGGPGPMRHGKGGGKGMMGKGGGGKGGPYGGGHFDMGKGKGGPYGGPFDMGKGGGKGNRRGGKGMG